MGRVTCLALCPTVRHIKPRPVPQCQAQQTLPCAPLSRTSNFILCPTVRHSKPRRGCCHLANSMSCHSRPTCHIAGCCHLVNSMSCHLRAPVFQGVFPPSGHQTSPCAPMSGTAKLAPCPTVRHSKPHCRCCHLAN